MKTVVLIFIFFISLNCYNIKPKANFYLLNDKRNETIKFNPYFVSYQYGLNAAFRQYYNFQYSSTSFKNYQISDDMMKMLNCRYQNSCNWHFKQKTALYRSVYKTMKNFKKRHPVYFHTGRIALQIIAELLD